MRRASKIFAVALACSVAASLAVSYAFAPELNRIGETGDGSPAPTGTPPGSEAPPPPVAPPPPASPPAPGSPPSPDPALNVSLALSSDSGNAPLTVNYTVNVTGGTPPYSYYLGFGDGNNSSLPSGEHTYVSNGTFVIGLTVTDSDNESAYASANVTVVGGAPPPAPVPPPLGFLVNDPGLADWLVDNSAYLRSGDAFYLQNGAGGTTPNVKSINAWADEIHNVDPGGVFVVQTATLANVMTLLGSNLSSYISGFSLEITPPTQTPPNQTTYLDEVQNFSAMVQPYHLATDAYLTGASIRYGWNFPLFGELVDHVTIEAQHSCSGGGAVCATSLHNEYAAAGLNTTGLSLQQTLGLNNLTDCLSMYNNTIAEDLGWLFLEFAGSTEQDLVQFLEAVDR